MNRSWMFVPADSERKLARCMESAADVVILDLEDSVTLDRKACARTILAQFMDDQPDHSKLWVRINALSSGELLKDLVAVVPMRPAGLLLPKIYGPEDLYAVEHYLDVLEVQHGLSAGSIKLCVLVTETPAAMLRMGELLQKPHPRVQGICWGAEDLSSAMGAGDPRDASGNWRSTYQFARSQALLIAHALNVEAVDTLYVDFKDPEGLARACQESLHDGFTGRVAIHPNQVDIINTHYSPSAEAVAMAQRIVEAFTPGVGAVQIDGKMYDIPHLKAANRLLESFSHA